MSTPLIYCFIIYLYWFHSFLFIHIRLLSICYVYHYIILLFIFLIAISVLSFAGFLLIIYRHFTASVFLSMCCFGHVALICSIACHVTVITIHVRTNLRSVLHFGIYSFYTEEGLCPIRLFLLWYLLINYTDYSVILFHLHWIYFITLKMKVLRESCSSVNMTCHNSWKRVVHLLTGFLPRIYSF